MKWIGTYAGYRDDVIREIKDNINHRFANFKNVRLLEPMCGSGIFLVECEKIGVSYNAFDINPVQVILCNSKLANLDNVDTKDILTYVKGIKINDIKDVVMARSWYDDQVVKLLLELYSSICTYTQGKSRDYYDILMGGLILTLRRNACHTASSNPTWIKEGGAIPGTSISKTFNEAINYIVNWHMATYTEPRHKRYGRVRTQDIKEMKGSEYYDVCVTSPPYCNRLDYKKMLGPEYHFVNKYIIKNYNDDEFIGSNVVRNFDFNSYTSTKYEIGLLKKIRSRQTYSDRDYYYKYYAKYFRDLEIIINSIMNALKVGGILLVSIQNSHYKGVKIELDKSIISKIEDSHVVNAVFKKDRPYFGNIIRSKHTQSETLLEITKT